MTAVLMAAPSLPGGGAQLWTWVGLAGLGAWHGLNPAMGWLFAAAMGLQEGRSRAAMGALVPLALGHALAVGAAVAVAWVVGAALPRSALRWALAAALVGYGLFRLLKRGHPRFGGMRMGKGGLTLWSFIMASAHGAGLMVLPLLLGSEGRGAEAGAAGQLGESHSGGAHAGHFPMLDSGIRPGGGGGNPVVGTAGLPDALISPEGWEALAAVFVHTGAYLLITGALAVLVVHWLGLSLLRTLWIDLDRIWAGALILTGLLTLVLSGSS